MTMRPLFRCAAALDTQSFEHVEELLLNRAVPCHDADAAESLQKSERVLQAAIHGVTPDISEHPRLVRFPGARAGDARTGRGRRQRCTQSTGTSRGRLMRGPWTDPACEVAARRPAAAVGSRFRLHTTPTTARGTRAFTARRVAPCVTFPMSHKRKRRAVPASKAPRCPCSSGSVDGKPRRPRLGSVHADVMPDWYALWDIGRRARQGAASPGWCAERWRELERRPCCAGARPIH